MTFGGTGSWAGPLHLQSPAGHPHFAQTRPLSVEYTRRTGSLPDIFRGIMSEGFDKLPAMADSIEVTVGVVVPASAIEMKAVRSSGPGGQNVNKVASRIELVVTVDEIAGLDEAARERLARLAGKRVDSERRLHVSSQESRDQRRNLENAREKVRNLVLEALVVPKKRRATRPGVANKERRLFAKKRDAKIKAGRRRAPAED